MAFGARRIFPNDQRASVAIGFNLPINGEGVFTPNYQTKDAIKNNLINYFLTNPGERPGNPNFGAGLRNFIFKQIDGGELNLIREDVQEKLLTNFPNVQIEDLSVLPTTVENTIQINITYSVRDTDISDDLTLTFN
tara:strand:+ start:1452 stop:1859 length:408 start_codon:yes stop_codon:yes gene_type:complete